MRERHVVVTDVCVCMREIHIFIDMHEHTYVYTSSTHTIPSVCAGEHFMRSKQCTVRFTASVRERERVEERECES